MTSAAVNVETLIKAMPGISADKASAYLGPMEQAMTEFDITSELRSAMWLAQVGEESASLVFFEELGSGEEYEGRADLGNTQPGDGPRFKGRGPIQITGRANYTAAGAALNLPLVTNPAMAAEPQCAFRVSAWWWANHGLNPLADAADVVGATRRINGGLNGLADRQQRYQEARALGAAVIPGAATPQEDEDMTLVIVTNPNNNGQAVLDLATGSWMGFSTPDILAFYQANGVQEAKTQPTKEQWAKFSQAGTL